MRSRPNQPSSSWLQTFIALITLVWVKRLYMHVFGRGEQRLVPKKLLKIRARNLLREEQERLAKLQQKQEKAEREAARMAAVLEKKQKQLSKAKVQSSRRRSESAPVAPAGKAQYKRRSDRSQPSQSAQERKSVPATPLLTFSIYPDRSIKAAVQSETVECEESLSPEEQRQFNRAMGQIELSLKVTEAIRAMGSTPLSRDSSIAGLVGRLAVIYQVHRLNLLCKSMQASNLNKDLQYNLRTSLVHRINSTALNYELLATTIAAVEKLDLSELSNMSFFNSKIDAQSLTQQLGALPLFRHLSASKDVASMTFQQARHWVEKVAIPVFNAITERAASRHDFAERMAHLDAQRMLVIIVGEHCGGVPADLSSSTADFMRACKELRNEFAHLAFVQDESDKRNRLVALASAVKVNAYQDNNDVITDLFTGTVAPVPHQKFQALTRGGDRSK